MKATIKTHYEWQTFLNFYADQHNRDGSVSSWGDTTSATITAWLANCDDHRPGKRVRLH